MPLLSHWVSSAARKVSGKSSEPTPPPPARVAKYELSFDLWAADCRSVTEYPAKAVIHLEPNDEREIFLSADPSRLSIWSVESNGKKLPFRMEGNQLIVAARNARTLQIAYLVKSTPDLGDHGLIEDAKNNRLWSMLWPTHAGSLFPANVDPSDAATTRIEMKLPLGWQQQASGAPQKDAFVQKAPAPAYTAAIYATDSFEAHQGGKTEGGVAVETFGAPGVSTPAIRTEYVEYARRGMEFLEGWLGKYEFGPRLALVEVEGGYGGMEHAGAVALMARAAAKPESARSVAVHEAAHHWFGNNVRIANWEHFWMSEGFTTYVTARAFEHIEGTKGFHKVLNEETSRLYGALQNKRQPLVLPEGVDIESAFSRVPYSLGAWMLRMFEVELGRERFDPLLKAWFQEKRGTAVDTEMFLSFVEERTGTDVRPIFERWSDIPSVPVFKGKVRAAAGDQKIHVQLTPTGWAPEGIAVPLTFWGADGETMTVRVNPGETQSFDTPFPVAYTGWDSERTLPVAVQPVEPPSQTPQASGATSAGSHLSSFVLRLLNANQIIQVFESAARGGSALARAFREGRRSVV